jgi:mycothiol system anti-sigma-R factor
MSCGDPHEVDCRDVLEQVYLYLDGEMPDEDCATIRRHLDECAPCLRQFGVEQEVKALVARTCGCDVAPDGLREKVLLRLRSVRLEIDHIEFRAE